MQTRKIIGVVVVLVALGVGAKFGYQYLADERVGLIGTARQSFIYAATDHCKRNSPGMSLPMQTALCKCYADGLADTLSNDDVIAIGTLDPRVSLPMQPKLDAAARVCGDRLRKTGHF